MFLILQAVFMIKSVEENITKKKGENYYEKNCYFCCHFITCTRSYDRMREGGQQNSIYGWLNLYGKK